MSGRLRRGFFARSVHDVARDLIGSTLLFDGCGGVVVETESYDRDDPACHAYGGPTPRNRVLFGPPGLAYVYISYGIHRMLNTVAESDGHAAAVLIRALQPTHGLEEMRARRGGRTDRDLCSGPGKLTQALGIGPEQNAAPLWEEPFRLLEPEGEWQRIAVVRGPRVGISRGVEAALALQRLGQPIRLPTPTGLTSWI